MKPYRYKIEFQFKFNEDKWFTVAFARSKISANKYITEASKELNYNKKLWRIKSNRP